MNESQTPWGENNVFDWYFSEECKVAVGIPIGNERGLEVISALDSIYTRIEEGDLKEAQELILLFAKMLISVGAKREDLIDGLEEELLVRSFNKNFDSFLEKLKEDNE